MPRLGGQGERERLYIHQTATLKPFATTVSIRKEVSIGLLDEEQQTTLAPRPAMLVGTVKGEERLLGAGGPLSMAYEEVGEL